MRKLLLFFSLLSLIIPLTYAQITFTGDVSVDFDNPSTVWAYDPCGEGDVGITSAMWYAGKNTGWDVYRIGFNYDRANDVMYIGWDYNGRICGDADGNGNPSTDNYLEPNKDDIANLGDGETITLWVDTDNSGGSEGGDIVLGVSKPGNASQYAVTYEAAGYGNPSNSFGTPVPAANGSYLYNAPSGPTASKPDFECTILNYSQMPFVNINDRLYDEVSFGIHVYSGSWKDGSVGYDKFTNSGWLIVTIPGVDRPPDPPVNLTHNYPRDLYVLEGIPIQVENGDPQVLFGPPFSTTTPGWPYWRVSRWDTDNQTYIRYEEPDYPVDLGLDPPPQQPGMGFWVVQDVEDDCQIEVTGYYYEEGDTVRIPLQNALPPSTTFPQGKFGQNQLANPFEVPFAWGDCLVQRADHSQPPMSMEDAFYAGIMCHYAAVWDPYNKQYIVKGYEDTFMPWQGFWTCVFDSLYEWEIIYVYPQETDRGSRGFTANAHAPHQDALNEWSFYIGITVDSIGLLDQYNYIGISSESEEDWDINDAPEMAPMVTAGGYVHIYFPHTDWAYRPGNFCYDFRQGPFEGEKIWNVDVRSYEYSGNLLLVWSGVPRIAPEYTASLLDETGNVLVADMSVEEDVLPITIAANEIKHYQVKIVRNIVGVSGNPVVSPIKYSLARAYPNPFNPNTSISFSVPVQSSVKLGIYDISGRLVKEAVNNSFAAGTHTVDINLSESPSGVYLIKAEADGKVFGTAKITLVK